MNVQILVDNKNSWIIPFAEKLTQLLNKEQHRCELIHDHSELKRGDVLFLLSCEKILPKNLRELHTRNLVVHESALPEGKGWSPLTWQVLEGKTRIPITLFEAADSVDSGEIYLQDHIVLEGHELVDELRLKQGEKTIEMTLKFVRQYPEISGRTQEGTESFYRRRLPADSELNLNQTLGKQFNLLRVCDNDRYPAWFELNGQKYIVKIYKQGFDS